MRWMETERFGWRQREARERERRGTTLGIGGGVESAPNQAVALSNRVIALSNQAVALSNQAASAKVIPIGCITHVTRRPQGRPPQLHLILSFLP